MSDARKLLLQRLSTFPSHPLLAKLPHLAGLKWLHNLKIGQKIAFVYALSLGVAVSGTSVGFLLSNHYHRQLRQQQDQLQAELELLNQSQINLLQIRADRQELILFLNNREQLETKYTELLQHHAAFEQGWSHLRQLRKAEASTKATPSSQVEATHRLFLRQSRTLAEYVGQLSELLLPLRSSSTIQPQQIPQVRQRLLNANRDQASAQLNDFSVQLLALIDSAQQRYNQTKEVMSEADRVHQQIVIAVMIASVLLAVLLLIWLTRALVRPLRMAISVAQQVTQDSNFALRVPVTTADEVGILAESLNHLIQRVQELLEAQQAVLTQKLIQSEKMSSLGEMLAGVAHEINNPVNFIYGNLGPINDYTTELLELIQTYENEQLSSVAVQNKTAEIDLEFMKEDLPKLLQSMQLGAERTRQIVLSLRKFSRVDETSLQLVDLHDCLDSTLLLLNSRIKKGVQIICNYGTIPNIEAYAGSLYQVLMNLLSNALDALDERSSMPLTLTDTEAEHSAPWTPQIKITTTPCENNQVEIKIADNGVGIAIEHLSHIFDTFFTTKPVGVGTGLGLSISHDIVVTKHRGRLSCQSQVGVGTEFTLVLPIRQPHPQP
jgi:signal transduction histidine kinase